MAYKPKVWDTNPRGYDIQTVFYGMDGVVSKLLIVCSSMFCGSAQFSLSSVFLTNMEVGRG